MLGSVRQTLDGVGQPLVGQNYDPWGVPTGGTSPNAFGFTGEWQDSATGLVNLRARWYQPDSGRFLARDPFQGVDSFPASFAPYAYAVNNPVLWTDPSGRCVPWLDPTCRPIWETGSGPNWEDFGKYWGTVGQTVGEAVIAPVAIAYNATTPEGQAAIARGAQVLWNDPSGSAKFMWEDQFAPFRDVYYGFVCADEEQIARGLTQTALLLAGGRGVRARVGGGWLSGTEGAIRGRVLGATDSSVFSMPKGVPERRSPSSDVALQVGRTFYLNDPKLKAKYPLGVTFTIQGYPDFTPYAMKQVRIKMRGNYTSDYKEANLKAG